MKKGFEKQAKRMILVIAVGVILGLGMNTLNRAVWSDYHSTDFTVYLAAGKAVLEGADIYEAHNIRGWYFLYLPILAIGMIPLTVIPVLWAALLWYALSIVMTGHAAYLAVGLARKFVVKLRVDPFWLYVLTILLVLWPLWSGITRGQVSILVLYLTLLGISLDLKRKPILAGMCFAGSIVIKVIPCIFLIYFLVKRKFRIFLVTFAALILFVELIPCNVFGIDKNHELLKHWWTQIVFPANVPDQSRNNFLYDQMIDPRRARNQSVQAVMFRWIAGSTNETADVKREPMARGIAWVLNVMILSVCFWVFCKRDPDDEKRDLLEICLVIPLMLFISPYSSVHYFSLLMLPVAVGLAGALNFDLRPSRFPIRFSIVCYTFFMILSLAIRPVHLLGALLIGTVGLWGGFLWLCSRCESLPDHRI